LVGGLPVSFVGTDWVNFFHRFQPPGMFPPKPLRFLVGFSLPGCEGRFKGLRAGRPFLGTGRACPGLIFFFPGVLTRLFRFPFPFGFFSPNPLPRRASSHRPVGPKSRFPFLFTFFPSPSRDFFIPLPLFVPSYIPFHDVVPFNVFFQDYDSGGVAPPSIFFP